MKQSLSFFIGIILLFTTVPAFAVTDVFTNPEDSYVRESSPDTNYGSEPVLIADGVSQDPNNGIYGEVASLVQWDISSIPSGATVTGVSITFNFSDASSGPYNLHVQNTSWSEGSVTWNELDSSAGILGIIPPFSFGAVSIPLNTDGIALVQGWVDGSIPNNGLAIRTSGTNNGIMANSMESGNTGPVLNVSYNTSDQSLEERVAYLENLLANLTRNGDELILEGMNFHIRNGLGATNGNPSDPDNDFNETAINGKGNLVIGYNEDIHPYNFSGEPASDKSGSHNVIIGHGHNYSSFGGLVVGKDNWISRPFASISGGRENVASGRLSSVSGGFRNTASGDISSVSGGTRNNASSFVSSISGGEFNIASGVVSSIGGGSKNIANGYSSSVTGGESNNANGDMSSVTGGAGNNANGNKSSVGGGGSNNASGLESTVSGGHARTAPNSNDWVAGSLFESF